MKQEWKNLKLEHFEHFQVSNYGRVRNSKTGNILSIGDNGHGYCNVTLKARPYEVKKYVHRLVAEAFLPDFDKNLQVNHIDKNKKNNNVTNLEMVTDSQNKKWSQKKYIDSHIQAQGKILQVFDLNDNLLFEGVGVYQTCRKHGFDTSAVYKVIKGKHKQHKGYKFKIKSIS